MPPDALDQHLLFYHPIHPLSIMSIGNEIMEGNPNSHTTYKSPQAGQHIDAVISNACTEPKPESNPDLLKTTASASHEWFSSFSPLPSILVRQQWNSICARDAPADPVYRCG